MQVTNLQSNSLSGLVAKAANKLATMQPNFGYCGSMAMLTLNPVNSGFNLGINKGIYANGPVSATAPSLLAWVTGNANAGVPNMQGVNTNLSYKLIASQHTKWFNHCKRTINQAKQGNASMANAMVYIELFNPLQRGKLYGSFGITALEAALIGRPVITMCANYDKYLERYDNECFEIVRNEDELIEAMQDCKRATYQHLETWGLSCRDTVAKAHHPTIIGNQLIEFINRSL
jgi:hypothetical protein